MTTLGHAGAVAALLVLSGCAHPPTDPAERSDYDAANDPAEPTNRAIFDGNQFVDRSVLKPVATAYQQYVPGPVRQSVHSFVTNLAEPKVLANDLLQGNVRRAWNTTQRFVVNSTVGVGGLFDMATDLGLPYHQADFGQTLGVWNVDPGPSVQLPLFGPSNVRDAVGTVVGLATDPLNFIPGGVMTTILVAGGGSGMLDARTQMLDVTNNLESQSLDYYAAQRSYGAQRRSALVEEGRAGEVLRGQVELGPITTNPGPGSR